MGLAQSSYFPLMPLGRISVSPAMRLLCSIWLRSSPWSLAVPVRWLWTDFCSIREDANDAVHARDCGATLGGPVQAAERQLMREDKTNRLVALKSPIWSQSDP